jgi:glycosyltransferase involved in cell wall biosynthesis
VRILVISQFFHPEMGAPAARFGDLGRAFVQAGDDVTVLTTFPNFPQGRIYPDARQQLMQTETIDGIHVIRTPILAMGGHTPTRKALLYASFAASALLRGLPLRHVPDIIIGTTPPPTVGYTSWLLAKRFGVPHVLDVRDIWPEAVVAAGRVKAGPAVHALEALNRVVLAGSAAVTTVSEGKKTRLEELGARPGTVHVLSNGADLARFDREARDHGDSARAWLAQQCVPLDKKLVVYAGVFNPPQGLDLVLDIARQRQAAGDERLHFCLVGDGSLRQHLQERVRTENLRQVSVIGPVDRVMVPGLYHAAWATLVILRPRKDNHTVPSKIYESMASGRPVILSADGEVAGIARTANCGSVSAAGDGPGLLAGLDALLAEDGAALAQGANGRRYVEIHNDRAAIAQRFRQVLLDATAGGRQP